MRFSSDWFYAGKLKAAPEVSQRGILQWDSPITWIDTAELETGEELNTETQSRINRPEAELLITQLKAYIEKITKERILEERIDFGIISPYKAQVYYLR